MKAVIVTGSRDLPEREWRTFIRRVIWERGAEIVIHGNCKGADAIGGSEAGDLGLSVIPMPAPWNRIGKAAGPYRNERMKDVLLSLAYCGYAVEVLAFHPDIKGSRGTRHMATVAGVCGVEVLVYDYPGAEPWLWNEEIGDGTLDATR